AIGSGGSACGKLDRWCRAGDDSASGESTSRPRPPRSRPPGRACAADHVPDLRQRGEVTDMHTLDSVDAASLRSDIPAFRAGDTLKVNVKVVEGQRSRIQAFQGVVIRRQGA